MPVLNFLKNFVNGIHRIVNGIHKIVNGIHNCEWLRPTPLKTRKNPKKIDKYPKIRKKLIQTRASQKFSMQRIQLTILTTTTSRKCALLLLISPVFVDSALLEKLLDS